MPPDLGNTLTGAWNAIADRVQPGAVVLLYHRIASPPQDRLQLSVRPDFFYEQVAHLKAHYHLCRLDEFSDLVLHQKKFPPGSVLISFDDGYADNFNTAIPILHTLDIQALFYITTSKLDTRLELWWDELERILLSENNLPASLDLTIENEIFRWSTTDPQGRLQAYQDLQRLLQYEDPESTGKTLHQLLIWSGLSPEGREGYRMMTREELKQMSESPSAVLGCHTHTHPALGMLPYPLQIQEILRSKLIVEQISGLPVRHFSYPFGSRKWLGNKRCYTPQTMAGCKELGFDMAMANYPGQVHRWSNRFALPRQLVRNWDIHTFTSKLRQFFHH